MALLRILKEVLKELNFDCKFPEICILAAWHSGGEPRAATRDLVDAIIWRQKLVFTPGGLRVTW